MSSKKGHWSEGVACADFFSVIALSGLGGHAFDSFKDRRSDYMWLRNALPYDITHKNADTPIARVMTYGFESGILQSKNIQNLADLATSFQTALSALARVPTTKPMILIAHSLGGVNCQTGKTLYPPGCIRYILIRRIGSNIAIEIEE